MTSRLEIRKDVRALDLRALLSTIDEVGESYQWRLEEIYGIGDLSELGITMLALENDIQQSAEGVEVSWPWIKSLAEQLDDLFDLMLVGRGPDSDEQIEIMLVDSSYWIIKGDRTILKMFESIA